MTLRDDLIASRALIDTPEKAERLSGGSFTLIARAVLGAVSGHPDRYADARQALRAQMPEAETLVEFSERPHDRILALFDRAIEAAKLTVAS